MSPTEIPDHVTTSTPPGGTWGTPATSMQLLQAVCGIIALFLTGLWFVLTQYGDFREKQALIRQDVDYMKTDVKEMKTKIEQIHALIETATQPDKPKH